MTHTTDLQQRLGYTFASQDLLTSALTHRSLSAINNERLEFLGDAVLGLIIANELYLRYPDASEGELSRLRSILVNRDTLAELAMQLQLAPHIQAGASELRNGGQFRQSMLADVLEAIIGAMFLDSDLRQTRQHVVQWYDQCYADLSTVQIIKDPKSRLQEWLQSKRLALPVYQCEVSGKAHAQTFHVTCHVDGYTVTGFGESTSRRRAEQLAAQHFLEQINE